MRSAEFTVLQIEKMALEGVLMDILPFLAEHYFHLCSVAQEDDNSRHQKEAKRDLEEILKAVAHLVFVAGDTSSVGRLASTLFPAVHEMNAPHRK